MQSDPLNQPRDFFEAEPSLSMGQIKFRAQQIILETIHSVILNNKVTNSQPGNQDTEFKYEHFRQHLVQTTPTQYVFEKSADLQIPHS